MVGMAAKDDDFIVDVPAIMIISLATASAGLVLGRVLFACVHSVPFYLTLRSAIRPPRRRRLKRRRRGDGDESEHKSSLAEQIWEELEWGSIRAENVLCFLVLMGVLIHLYKTPKAVPLSSSDAAIAQMKMLWTSALDFCQYVYSFIGRKKEVTKNWWNIF